MRLRAFLCWANSLGRRDRRAPAVLAVLAALSLASGLGATAAHSRAVPFGTIEVSAGRAPSFGLIPLSRRDDAVLRSQPQVQTLGVGTTLARAKLARLQGDRIRRLAGAPTRRRLGPDGEHDAGRPSGAAAARLRAPPPPG
jgi:hypothetical protein